MNIFIRRALFLETVLLLCVEQLGNYILRKKQSKNLLKSLFLIIDINVNVNIIEVVNVKFRRL